MSLNRHDMLLRVLGCVPDMQGSNLVMKVIEGGYVSCMSSDGISDEMASDCFSTRKRERGMYTNRVRHIGE